MAYIRKRKNSYSVVYRVKNGIKYNTTYDFKKNENHLRRSLFGGEAGIKIGYSFGKIDGSIGYNFQYGFSHIYEEKARTSKTARRNSSVITAGIAYKLF